MTAVAQQYPARTDSNGTTWYRPTEGEGWTADERQAHPSYAAQQKENNDGRSDTDGVLPELPGTAGEALHATHGIRAGASPLAPPEPHTTPAGGEHQMTALTDDGEFDTITRHSETMGYPLPPLPPRARVTYDGWGRYKLPSPTTGRPTAYTRATTVADTMDDKYNLSLWKRRETVKRVAVLMDGGAFEPHLPISKLDQRELAVLRSDILKAITDEDKKGLDRCLDQLDNLGGGRDAAELGGAVHAWLEAVDIGAVLPADVPDMFKPYVTAYLNILRRHGLVAVPMYVERIVLNDRGEETVVGTLDRIYRIVATGELVLGDVKTSRSLDFSWLTYAVQFAVYGYATLMFKTDGSGWEPMPELRQDMAICLHVPSDQPERAAAVTFDLWFGGEAMIESLSTRRRRKAAKNAVPYVHAIPTPTKESLRYVEAWQALQNVSQPGHLAEVWEQYQEVWDDDLTQYGETVAALL